MRLRNERAEVVVDLEHGGRIASVVVDGLSLLLPDGADPSIRTIRCGGAAT